MKKITEIIFRFKITITIIVVIIFIISIFWLTRLESNNDMVSFLSQDDPDVILLNETGEKFGSNYMIMIAVETDDIFTHRNLNLIKEITEKIEVLSGVEHTVSLTNILDIRKIPGGLEVSQLIDEDSIPGDKQQLEKLRSYILSKEMYRGTIINDGGNAALIIVRLRTSADKEMISQKCEKIVHNAVKGMKDTKAYFSGMPMWIYHANKLMLNDLSFLTPLVALLIITILYLGFRSFRGVVLPFSTVILATAFSLGMMSLFGIELTLLSAALPVVLLSTGTAYGIHLLNADREVTMMGVKKPRRRVELALDKVGIAILLSALTTMFGFTSLVTANIIPIREFGGFISVGIFYALFVTLCFIPIILKTWSNKKAAKKGMKDNIGREHGISGGDRGILIKLANFSVKHSYKIIAVAIAVVIISAIMIPRIKTEVNMSRYFPEDSVIRRAERLLEREFAGSNPVVVDIRTENVKHPAVLRLTQRLQKRLRATEHIKNLRSVADYIMEMNFIMNNHRVTPNTVYGVENLWLFIEGKKELSQVVGEHKEEAIIQGIVDSSSSKVLDAVAKEVEIILKSTPGSLSQIETDSLNEEQRAVLWELYTPFVLEEIEYDLKYADIKIIDKNKIESNLIEKAADANTPLKYSDAEVRSALSKYLSSEIAEISFDSEENVKALISEIMNMSEWSINEVKKIIRRRAPRWILKDDPPAIDALAESLQAQRTAALRNAKVDWMLETVSVNVEPALETADNITIQRLKGDLFELTEDKIWIPAWMYEQVLNEKPDNIIEVELRQTGTAKISSNIFNRLVTSVFESLGIALFLVFILLSIQFRSVIGGLISMVPIAFTIICNFCVMGLFGIPLDVATAMIAGVAIGIGIDYTIHIKTRFKKEFSESGDIKKALCATITTAGRAVLINTIAVMMGFLVLLLSEFEPIRRFGYLTALTMFVSALGAIVLFSSIVIIAKPKFLLKINKKN